MSVFIPLCHPVYENTGNMECCTGQLILLDADGTSVFLRKEFVDHLCFPELSEFPDLHPDCSGLIYVGCLNGVDCFAAEYGENMTLPEESAVCSEKLRMAYQSLTPAQKNAVARAKELLFWRKQHRFCGRCHAVLVESPADIALMCPDCDTRYYPQIAPAVIVGVTRGKSILLAHNKRFENNIHGLIAGFIEAGESVEQAIEREIWEEVGIKVKNIRYFSSQSWPFPNSLMLGFTAEYESGEAEPDGEELDSLDWFSFDQLPQIPPEGSIARQIIDDFVVRCSAAEEN